MIPVRSMPMMPMPIFWWPRSSQITLRPTCGVMSGDRHSPLHVPFLGLTLDDLVLLRDVYQRLRDGQALSAVAKALGISRNRCNILLNVLSTADPQGADGGPVRKLRQAEDPARLPEVVF